MNWEEATQAFEDAKRTMRQVDRIAGDMAHMLRGRLRKCGSYDLECLKRELRDFNIHTGEWMR